MTTLIINFIDLGNNGTHPLVTVSIGGTYFSMVVDTGASGTVFDLKFIQEISPESVVIEYATGGVGLNDQKIETHRCVIDNFKIGGIRIDEYEAIILNLDHINKLYKEMGGGAIGGILGSDLLLKLNAVINYKDKLLTLGHKL